MPKRYTRRYSTRSRRSTKMGTTKRRRLGVAAAGAGISTAAKVAAGLGAAGAAYKYSKGGHPPLNTIGNLRGPKWDQYVANRRKGFSNYIGKAPVDAASGAKPGFRCNLNRKGRNLQRRRVAVMKTIVDSKFPVVTDHHLDALGQMDWTSGTQAVMEYTAGYSPQNVESMITQAASAQSTSTAAMVIPTVTTAVNQRLDVYAKTSKFNLKNTCSHTVHLEVHVYKSKMYHTRSFLASWQDALLADNMVQNSATFGTEQVYTDPGNRPDFKHADLNVRWQKVPQATYKCAMEPGQETSYSFTAPGFRYDQAKYNVTVGGSDPTFGPFTYQVVFFARSELVCDSLDTDVTYGSGHLAMNREVWSSWAAVPYVKPFQASFTNSWGTVVEANELDLNLDNPANTVYTEQV